jgi:hypothetical protein
MHEGKTVPQHTDGRGGIATLNHYLGTKWERVVSLTPRPRFRPRNHCTRDWMGPRTDLNTKGRRKILLPLPGIEPQSSGRPVRIQTLY